MNDIQMAAKMYEARDSARTLYGAEFEAKIAGYQTVIRALMKKHECCEIVATTKACEEAKAQDAGGLTILLFLAACVEMIEPTPKAVAA